MRDGPSSDAIQAIGRPHGPEDGSKTHLACFNEEAAQAYTCPIGTSCCGTGRIEADLQDWNKCCVAPIHGGFELNIWWTLSICLGAFVLSAAGFVLYMEQRRRGAAKKLSTQKFLDEAFPKTIKMGPGVSRSHSKASPASSDGGIEAIRNQSPGACQGKAYETPSTATKDKAAKSSQVWSTAHRSLEIVSRGQAANRESSTNLSKMQMGAGHSSISGTGVIEPESPVMHCPEDVESRTTAFSSPAEPKKRIAETATPRFLRQHASPMYPNSPDTLTLQDEQRSTVVSPYKPIPLATALSNTSRISDVSGPIPHPLGSSPQGSPSNSAIQERHSTRSRLGRIERPPMNEVDTNAVTHSQNASGTPTCGDNADSRSGTRVGKENEC